MRLLDLQLDEIVLILGFLHVRQIGRAAFVCRRLREASDVALATVKYVKLRSKSEKFVLALADKLKSVRTVVNDCDDSEKIIQKLALRCTRIEKMYGFLPQHVLYYIRMLKSAGHVIKLKKLVICALKKDIRIATIEILLEEWPCLKLDFAVGNSPGSQYDLGEILSDKILGSTEGLSIRKIPYQASGKLTRLKEIEMVGTETVNAVALADFIDSSNCKLQKITLSLVSSDFLSLFERHMELLREVSFYNYDVQLESSLILKFKQFVNDYCGHATAQVKRKLFASFECSLDMENLISIENSQWVSLLIHSVDNAVIQQIDSKHLTFLKRYLLFVRFGEFSGKQMIDLLKRNTRVVWTNGTFFCTERH